MKLVAPKHIWQELQQDSNASLISDTEIEFDLTYLAQKKTDHGVPFEVFVNLSYDEETQLIEISDPSWLIYDNENEESEDEDEEDSSFEEEYDLEEIDDELADFMKKFILELLEEK